MKKILIVLGVAVLAIGAQARPHGGFGGHRPPPPMHHHGGFRHHGGWGHGGRNFWPGFVGGVVGSAVYNAIRPAPVVVTTPTVVAPAVVTTPTIVTTPAVTTVQNVWVEGRYVDQVGVNGVVVRVWQPGHYEQMSVVVP